MMEALSNDAKLELIDSLEEHKLFFRTFWSVSDVLLTTTIPTACVRLVDGRFQFLFNPDFWESGGLKFKLFLIGHEQLHIMLNHFKRMKFELGDARNKNIAADISINHHLIRNYDFNREIDIPNWNKYCWVETIFPEQPRMPNNETVEFYYAQLRSRQEDSGGGDTFDDHEQTQSGLGDRLPDDIQEAIDNAVKDMVDQQTEGMTDEQKEDWLDQFSEDFKQSLATEGFGSGSQTHDIKKTNSNCWKSLYYNIPKRVYKQRTRSQWIQPSRRSSLLPPDLLIPGDYDFDVRDVVRVNVYLDSSGSCTHHAKYFLETAMSINAKWFSVDLFAFGTQVYPLPKKPPFHLRGFGNESYQAVSDHVDTCKNVDAVMVLTDGYSKSVIPKQPNKWHWFITPNGTTKHIDHRCHTYDLAKFNWNAKPI